MTVRVAVPELSVEVPSDVVPLQNVTVPVAADAAIIAVRVTEAPTWATWTRHQGKVLWRLWEDVVEDEVEEEEEPTQAEMAVLIAPALKIFNAALRSKGGYQSFSSGT